MSGFQAMRLDPFKAAQTGRTIEADIPVSGLPRLAAAIMDEGAKVQGRFVFFRDEQGRGRLRMSFSAELVLRCERCLGALRQTFAGEVVFRLIDPELERVPENEEALEVGKTGIRLADVLEDELLLALPLIPRHRQRAECDPDIVSRLEPEAPPAARDHSPFDVLKQLKH